MRFMLISDIHGSVKAVEAAAREAEKRDVDIILVAGDITHFGGADEAEMLLSRLPGKKIAVPGNCDSPEIVDSFEKSGTLDVHGKKLEVNGLCFAGLGASNPLPFSTLYTYSEENIGLILDAVMGGCDIMITHTPPLGILDMSMFGHRGGSASIRKIVEKYRPALHVFGHMHEAGGAERIDSTVFVNAGAARDGNAAIIDLENRDTGLEVPDIEFIDLFSG